MKRLVLGCLLVAGLVAPVLAQGAPSQVRIRGTVATLAGNVLTVNSLTGTSSAVTLAPDVRITYVVKSSLDKIAAGSYIGVAAEPQADGTLKALAIQIFPPGLKPGPGTRPWDKTATSTMTNGTVDTIDATKVDKVDAHVYTVTYEGGSKKIVVTPDTIVVESLPADVSALKPGAHAFIFATRKDDGSTVAGNVGIGKDGFVPPL